MFVSVGRLFSVTVLLDPIRHAADDLQTIDVTTLSRSVLGELVVELRALITGLEAEHARILAEADRAGVWATDGATSLTTWLAHTTHSTIGRAKSQVKLADTLAKQPTIAAAMRAGALSLDNANLLANIIDHPAFADDAAGLIDQATTESPGELRRSLDHWTSGVTPDSDAERDAARHARRTLTLVDTDDNMVELRGLLTPQDGRTVRNALGHLAGTAWDDHSGRTHTQRHADALVSLCDAFAKGTITGGRERPKLLVTVAYETILERAATRGHVHTGETLSGNAVRRLACDAELHRIITSGQSTTLDFGAATRLVSDSIYLALVERDGGCRFPGCDRPPGWCEAHHIIPFPTGPTSIANTALHCNAHHHLIHQPGWHLHGDGDNLHYQTPDGRTLHAPTHRRTRHPSTTTTTPTPPKPNPPTNSRTRRHQPRPAEQLCLTC